MVIRTLMHLYLPSKMVQTCILTTSLTKLSKHDFKLYFFLGYTTTSFLVPEHKQGNGCSLLVHTWFFFFCSSGEIPISDFTLVIKSGLPDFDEFALNFPLVSGKTMQNEIFELAFRRSENMVIWLTKFSIQGCKIRYIFGKDTNIF